MMAAVRCSRRLDGVEPSNDIIDVIFQGGREGLLEWLLLSRCRSGQGFNGRTWTEDMLPVSQACS